MIPVRNLLNFKKIIVEKMKDSCIEAADLYVLGGMPEFKKNMILEEMSNSEFYLKENMLGVKKGNLFII